MRGVSLKEEGDLTNIPQLQSKFQGQDLELGRIPQLSA